MALEKSGSGKSVAIAQKILYRMLTEDDHNFLVVRKTGNTLHKSCFALLVSLIKQYGLEPIFTISIAEGREKIIFKGNGNMIQFSGLDDVERLKSIANISSIWVEEASEIEESDFNELNRRLRGYQGMNSKEIFPGVRVQKYMQFMISFNPISSLHWLKKRFYDDENKLLIWEQKDAMFYLQNKKNLSLINKHKLLVIHSTYKDNRFIDKSYGEEMEALKRINPYEYDVYTLGLFGIVGRTYFDKEVLNKRVNELRKIKPIKRGYFEYKTRYDKYEDTVLIDDDTIKWVDDKEGYIAIYEDVQRGYPYVIGGDTAGDGSDKNIGQVLNNITSKQIATLKIDSDETLYARQMYCLGIYYNTALIGIETNFSTYPIKELERLNYRNLYIREERPDAFTNKLSKIHGFNTNKATRPEILGILRDIVKNYIERIVCIETLSEMTTFVINEKGKAEAAAGEHDDFILALAIAYKIREMQRDYVKVEKKEMSIIEKDKERLAKLMNRNRKKNKWNRVAYS